MFTQEVTVNNEVGLHARPATYFIQKANEFKSGIWVEKDERRVNAKSLLGVLSLGIVKGTTITLIPDAAGQRSAGRVNQEEQCRRRLPPALLFTSPYAAPKRRIRFGPACTPPRRGSARPTTETAPGPAHPPRRE